MEGSGVVVGHMSHTPDDHYLFLQNSIFKNSV